MNANNYYTTDVQGAYQIYDLGDFVLKQGRTVPDCKLAYTTLGKLNAAKDNVI